MNTASYELITARITVPAAAPLAPYTAVQFDTAGKAEPAATAGTRPFAGITQYEVDEANGAATIVKGIYPVVANAAIAAGNLIAFVGGKATVAATGANAVAVALTPAAAGELTSVATLDGVVTA